MLASLAARAIPLASRALRTTLLGLTTGLISSGIKKGFVVVEMDFIYTNMINAIEYRNIKAMVSIYLHILGLLKVVDCCRNMVISVMVLVC